jgi:hypothetical protein
MKKGIAILVLAGIMGFSAVNTAEAFDKCDKIKGCQVCDKLDINQTLGNVRDCLNGLLGRLQGSCAEASPPVAEELPVAPTLDAQGGIHLLPYINLGRSPEGRIGGQLGLRFGIFRNHDIRFGLDCI